MWWFFLLSVCRPGVFCPYVICPGSSFRYATGHTTSCWYLILGRMLRVVVFFRCLSAAPVYFVAPGHTTSSWYLVFGRMLREVDSIIVFCFPCAFTPYEATRSNRTTITTTHTRRRIHDYNDGGRKPKRRSQ